jgi:uncharacterized protein
MSLWEWLLGALALTLVLEGLLPLLNPGGWRRTFERVMQLTDGQLRFMGLVSIGLGLLLLALFGPSGA